MNIEVQIGVICSILCKNCECVYIGETGYICNQRILEHQFSFKNCDSNSKLVHHTLETDHIPDF